MPGELKDKIKIQAIKEKLSMNEYIVRILSEAIKKAEFSDKQEVKKLLYRRI